MTIQTDKHFMNILYVDNNLNAVILSQELLSAYSMIMIKIDCNNEIKQNLDEKLGINTFKARIKKTECEYLIYSKSELMSILSLDYKISYATNDGVLKDDLANLNLHAQLDRMIKELIVESGQSYEDDGSWSEYQRRKQAFYDLLNDKEDKERL